MAGTVRPAVLLADRERSARGVEVAARLGARVFDITGLSPGCRPEPSDGPPGGTPPLAALAAAEEDSDLAYPGLRETDPHVIFFTSGSTGRPKGVVISHRVSYLRSYPGALLEPRGATDFRNLENFGIEIEHLVPFPKA